MTIEEQFVGVSRAIVPYLVEEGVTDILINGTRSLYVEKCGQLERREILFPEEEDLYSLIERMLIPLGKGLDARHPFADGTIAGGSRFHIILPPLVTGGPQISIRRHSRRRFALSSFGDRQVSECLKSALQFRKNILIAGGTGSGKTSLMSTLIDQISETERVILIEETAEVQSSHRHLVSLVSRVATVDGIGEVSLRTLLKNSLRMRPSRVVLGECRGEEVMDLLQALNIGHPGSFCTIHASGSLDALRRLEVLATLSGYRGDSAGLRQWITSALNLIVFMERNKDSREVVEIIELCGVEGANWRYRPVWKKADEDGAPALQVP